MIAVQQKRLFFLFGIISIFLIPFMFLGLPSWFESIRQYLIVIIFFEFLIYFLAELVQTEWKQVFHVFVYSLIIVFIRGFVSLIGTVIYAPMSNMSFNSVFYQLWIGNPVAQLFQILLLLYFIPHIMIYIAPGLLKQESRNIIHPSEQQKSRIELSKELYFAEPMGGFIRVYSFNELQTSFRKMIGLEGFLIYSNEGLIVWEDLAINFDIEKLIVEFMRLQNNIDGAIGKFEILDSEKYIIDTPDHIIFNVKLNKGFYLVAFFNKKIQLTEIYPRMKMLIKSAQEFLSEKYNLIYK